MSSEASQLQEANALLTKEGAGPKEWGQGIALLNEVKSSGQSSASLEANLGRAYFKLENYAKSVEHFELAVLMDRSNWDYRADLDMAREKVAGGMGTRMEHPAEWGARISSVLRPQELLFSTSLLLFALLAYNYLKGQLPKALQWGLFAGIFLLYGVGFFALTGNSVALISSRAAVTVRSAPLESAEEVTSIQPGSRVRLLQKSGDFAEIERPNSFRGWVAVEDVTPVKDLK